MGNVFETCSISKKASINISEPTSLEDMNYEKVFEPETALETRTGKIHKRTLSATRTPLQIQIDFEFCSEPVPISMNEVSESDMTTTGLCIIRYISSSETEAASLMLNPNRSDNSIAKSPESDSVYSSKTDLTSRDELE